MSERTKFGGRQKGTPNKKSYTCVWNIPVPIAPITSCLYFLLVLLVCTREGGVIALRQYK
jgi:hypothetical protein